MKLSHEEILNYYSKRWEIETHFIKAKNYLSLQGYQGRSSKALDRYLILQIFVEIYCTHTCNVNLLKGLRKYHAKKESDRIEDMIDIFISSLKYIVFEYDYYICEAYFITCKKGLRVALRSSCYQFKEVT